MMNVVSRNGSYTRVITEEPLLHRQIITRIVAEAVAVRFTRPARGDVLSVVDQESVRVEGWYDSAPLRFNFYRDSLGVCDISSRPAHLRPWRPLGLVEKVFRGLFEEELRCGSTSFSPGMILRVPPENRRLAAHLVYLAVLRHTCRKVAVRVARNTRTIFPEIAGLAQSRPALELSKIYEQIHRG